MSKDRHVKNAGCYVIGPLDPGKGDLRTAAHIVCHGCGETGSFTVGSQVTPDHVQRVFIRNGWQCDVFKPARCFCGHCLVVKAAARKGKLARDRSADLPATESFSPPLPFAMSFDGPFHPHRLGYPELPRYGPLRFPVQTEATLPLETPMLPVSPTPASVSGAKPATPAPTLKPLTVQQRTALRDLLDQYFDPAPGRYVKPWSDHAIAERLKIPRKHVEDVRETAYGPIQGDADLDEAEKELAKANACIAQSKTMVDEALALLERAMKLNTLGEEHIAEHAKKLAEVKAKLNIK